MGSCLLYQYCATEMLRYIEYSHIVGEVNGSFEYTGDSLESNQGGSVYLNFLEKLESCHGTALLHRIFCASVCAYFAGRRLEAFP
jgi:hypothetical protein